ncbi:uncharacterized protein DUF4352 [Streptomyces sp. TLI_235]|nr:DUF4352 domain-containing protein [Streptomyces sp. TLI_235]PBC78096.1 uncharacterized protein DUF4352 [Streptomyces sp. TLI_235]
MTRSTVRRSAAVLLAASLVALGATACNTGASSVSTEAKKPASGAPASAAGTAGTAKQGAAAPAKVGDTIALKGFEKTTTADVTVVKVVDNAEGEDEFSKPADGKRFVAVQFRIKAIGKAYSDAPANSAKLLDAQGQSFSTSFYDTKAGQGFSGSVNIAPGESGLGFLTFEVPKDAVLDKVQFTLDSGMADQTGQWKLS